MKLIDFILVFGLLLTILITAVTLGEHNSWIGHAVAGVFSLILLLMILITGSMLAGRLKRKENVDIFSLHKRLGIWFCIFVVGTFLFGLTVETSNGGLLLADLHGVLGLLVVIFAVAQLVSSLIFQNRTHLRTAHRIIGYILAPLLTIQLISGVYTLVIGSGREIVLLHSMIGGLSGLLFVWIIFELRNIGTKSVNRAAYVSYFGALLNIIGCWIIGGYNYLTNYSPIRELILTGSQPWAHEILMELKENFFFFLPMVSILLALTLNLVTRNSALMEDIQVKKALTLTAGLALFLVLLIFIIGAMISGAALQAQGGKL